MMASNEPVQTGRRSNIFQSGALRSLIELALVTILYFVAGRASLGLASLHQSASPVWPPSGLALAAVLILGSRVWPAILLGAFLVNAITLGDLLPSFGMACGNTAEALLGGWLVARLARGERAFETAGSVLRFVFLAAMVAPVASATTGVLTLGLAGLARWERLAPIWLTWWVGDMVGVLLVTPILVVWSQTRFRTRHDFARLAESAGAVLLMVLVASMVFGGVLPALLAGLPVAFLCFPPLLWPVFRLGRSGTVAALGALAAVALAGTLRGDGPFAQYDLNTSLLLLQAFLATIVITNLVLVALVGERGRVSDELEASQIVLRGQLREIEDLYRTAPVGLCLLDRDLRFVRINARLAEINGLPASAHIGRTVREVVPDLAEGAESLIRGVLASGLPLLDHEIEGTTAARPGIMRQWLESYYPVRGPAGAVEGVACVVQEITAIKEAEATERERRRLEVEAEAHSRIEAEVAAAVENERQRLGQELHEGLGQELTGIAYLMATLQRTLSGAAKPEAAEATRLESMITSSIERTRSLAKAFYPVEMEMLGLVGSLEEMAWSATRSMNVECRVYSDLDVFSGIDPRGSVAIQLFRIAQEAIYYEVEHGHARHIDISVSFGDDRVVLSVVGDGNGSRFDIDEVDGAELRIMQYRAGIIGGTLDVRTPSAGGTAVRCSAPIPSTWAMTPQ
jgi:PAS domain S-box-containing protein